MAGKNEELEKINSRREQQFRIHLAVSDNSQLPSDWRRIDWSWGKWFCELELSGREKVRKIGINFFSFGLKLMNFANGIKFAILPRNFSRFQMLLISTHFKFIHLKVLWICFGLTGKSRQPQKSCWYTKLSKILPQLIRFGSLLITQQIENTLNLFKPCSV